jgi:hydrogenase expression/formation protein HypE
MKPDRIQLDHGSGGRISHDLVTGMMLPAFRNPLLEQLHDGAVMGIGGSRVAFSTDSYVVDPLFFPGGNIGDLAVNGTVNDISMCGAVPLYLSVGLIMEEGFPVDDLQRILLGMSQAAESAGVWIVTGDTKVVPRGAADRIFINTSGIGIVPEGVDIRGDRAVAGDRVLLSGCIADHGMTILTQREGLAFDHPIQSDTASLNRMVGRMLEVEPDIHVLRDPTRGGLGTSLNEIAMQSRVGIRIVEDRIPIRKEVAGLCELLGFDPLYVANEGKLIAIVPAESAARVLDAVRQTPGGESASIIGDVVSDHPGRVRMQTRIGGVRIVDMLSGEQLPRIC